MSKRGLRAIMIWVPIGALIWAVAIYAIVKLT